jgi:DNA-binding transcriptional ArsR family regulator
VFSALADPKRRAILVRLAEGEASVSELARPFDVSLPAITKHLGVLERAGLLEHHKEGRVRHCRLVAAPMRLADAWLSDYRVFWEQRLDSLIDHLKSNQESHDLQSARPAAGSADPSDRRATRSSLPRMD